jgi:molybdopterin-guanine dinucleotide biosynthesis protein A
VTWRREDPPGSGPVAAVAAGIGDVRSEVVLVLAADLPSVAPAVPVLRAALDGPGADVAALVDATGHLNYLAAAWRTAALRRALSAAGVTADAPVRSLFVSAEVVAVVDAGRWGADCDTWDDLAGARRRAEQRSAT